MVMHLAISHLVGGGRSCSLSVGAKGISIGECRLPHQLTGPRVPPRSSQDLDHQYTGTLVHLVHLVLYMADALLTVVAKPRAHGLHCSVQIDRDVSMVESPVEHVSSVCTPTPLCDGHSPS